MSELLPFVVSREAQDYLGKLRVCHDLEFSIILASPIIGYDKGTNSTMVEWQHLMVVVEDPGSRRGHKFEIADRVFLLPESTLEALRNKNLSVAKKAGRLVLIAS